MKHMYSKGEYPKMRELLYLKCTNTQMFISKHIMDMMDKIPKNKEEDIIIARIPKRTYPKNFRNYTQNI